MSNNRRNRKTAKGARQGVMGKARAQMKLAANVTEEQDWYLDTPDVRLTRIFTVVLLLHVVAIGGILAFKMVDKASETSGIKISTARQTFESAVQEAKVLASEVPAATATATPAEIPALPAPAVPLRPDPSKGAQYRVQAGDTLTEIAAELGVSPAALREKNALLSDNELYPGRWLTIPGKGETIAAPAVQEAAAPAPVAKQAAAAPAARPETTAKAGSYVVKPGDTAWAIARKLNVPFNKLLSDNGIKNAEALQIGQQLRIPGGN